MSDEPRRTVKVLGDAEMDAIWQYGDPLWPAVYAWHPEAGWLYWTTRNSEWLPSSAGAGHVSHDTIDPLGRKSGESIPHQFIELARIRPGEVILFTDQGAPVHVPESIDTSWVVS